MAKQTINVGTAANDGTGDTLRAAMGKVNANFAELYAGPASIVATGLSITVSAFRIDEFSFAGGSIAAVTSKIQWLVVNLYSGAMHCLPRVYGDGEIVLARIVAGASTITSIESQPLRLPVTRIPVALAKMRNEEALSVAFFGSSLIEGAYGNPWRTIILDGLDFVTPRLLAVGGTNARYAASFFGRGTTPTSAGYNNTNSIMEGGFPRRFVRYGLNVDAARSGGNGGAGVDLSPPAELLIIGLLPNGGQDRLAVYEGVVRIARQRGAEVLLVTDNAFAHPGDAAAQDSDELWTDGQFVRDLASKYGCAIADTAAYMREGEWRGAAVYGDTIHQSQLGHDLCAESVMGSLRNGLALSSIKGAPTIPPVAPDSHVPGRIDIELLPIMVNTAMDGIAGNSVTSHGGNALAAYYGMPDTIGRTISAGEGIFIGHPLMMACDIVFDARSTCTIEVRTSKGFVLLDTISVTGIGGTRPVAMNVFRSFPASSVGLQVMVTAGTLDLYGVTYHCPDYRDVTDEFSTRGEWVEEASSIYGYAAQLSADDAGAFASLTCQCKSLAILLENRNYSGKINQFANGIASVVDLFSGGAYFQLYKPVSGGVFGNQSLVLELRVDANGSAASPNTGARQHRLSIVQAFAISDR